VDFDQLKFGNGGFGVLMVMAVIHTLQTLNAGDCDKIWWGLAVLISFFGGLKAVTLLA
jgi:hypothetical protein